MVEKSAERRPTLAMRLNDLLRLNLSFGYRICTGGI